MAIGLEVALVLRAKGGANFLTQTQGIGIKDSIDATAEAQSILSSYTQNHKLGESQGQGDNPPGYASGQLLVCSGRLLVVYRLVNSIWIMTVTPASTNVLLCAHLIWATCRLLVTACKGVDVTPDKVARKYPEVYIATGQLLCLGGLSVESSSILAIAEADVLSISPENKLKPKGTAAAVKNRLGLVNRKTLPSAPSSASLHSPSPDPSVTTRVRTDETDVVGGPFLLPDDALTLQAAVHIPMAPSTAAAPPASPADAMDDLFGPAIPVQGSEFLAGTGLETLEAPTNDYGSFANLRPPPPPPMPSANPWGDFDTGLPAENSKSTFVSRESLPPPKPTYPPPTSKQQRSIANGNALQLVELWKASYVGTKLDMAGTFGEVLASGTVPRCSAEVAMRLDPPAAEADALSASIRAVQGEPGVTETADDGVIVARLSEATSPEVPFARYRLPALSVQPPVLLTISVSEKPKMVTAVATVNAAPVPAEPKQNLQALPSAFHTAAEQGGEFIDEEGYEDLQRVPEEAFEEIRHADASPVIPAPSDIDEIDNQAGQAIDHPITSADHAAISGPHVEGSQNHTGEVGTQPSMAADPAITEQSSPRERMVSITAAVQPAAKFSPKNGRLRWELYSMEPGAQAQLRVICKPSIGGPALDAACAALVANLHAFGSHGQGLSQVSLLSGKGAQELKTSRMAFHCEVQARPERLRRKIELTKQDMLAMALRMYESHRKQAATIEVVESEQLTDQL